MELKEFFNEANCNKVLKWVQKIDNKATTDPIERKCYCCLNDEEAKQNFAGGSISQQKAGTFKLRKFASNIFPSYCQLLNSSIPKGVNMGISHAKMTLRNHITLIYEAVNAKDLFH